MEYFTHLQPHQVVIGLLPDHAQLQVSHNLEADRILSSVVALFLSLVHRQVGHILIVVDAAGFKMYGAYYKQTVTRLLDYG